MLSATHNIFVRNRKLWSEFLSASLDNGPCDVCLWYVLALSFLPPSKDAADWLLDGNFHPLARAAYLCMTHLWREQAVALPCSASSREGGSGNVSGSGLGVLATVFTCICSWISFNKTCYYWLMYFCPEDLPPSPLPLLPHTHQV